MITLCSGAPGFAMFQRKTPFGRKGDRRRPPFL
jgi:hypothetical protein